jgi:hypothetical protein
MVLPQNKKPHPNKRMRFSKKRFEIKNLKLKGGSPVGFRFDIKRRMSGGHSVKTKNPIQINE